MKISGQFIREFKVRETKVTRALLTAAAIFIGGITISEYTAVYVNPAITLLFGIVISSISIYKWYRCPNCNKVPVAYGGVGVQFSPKECSNCGEKLREG